MLCFSPHCSQQKPHRLYHLHFSNLHNSFLLAKHPTNGFHVSEFLHVVLCYPVARRFSF